MTEDLVLGVACETCGEPVDHRCTEDGAERDPHPARVARAKLAQRFGVLNTPEQRRLHAADARELARLAYAPASTSQIALVSCAASKLPSAAAARDLYCSPLFRKASEYAERVLGMPWFVLSAKHGLVHPDMKLAPYDLALGRLSVPDRRAWGSRVRAAIRELACWTTATSSPRSIVVLGGQEYTRQLHALTGAYSITEPLLGKAVGERLAWLNAQLARPAA